ncbi:unnamed protein product [Paramecium sonneborni]|uniref:Peptidase C51 domain-containing protein n=1 Tax=Paramecium sonneborni TaxID=65129 RepID=A0A8S1LGJ8_9CILI|nr:unnamed protein product [Paramecium sonneborni]
MFGLCYEIKMEYNQYNEIQSVDYNFCLQNFCIPCDDLRKKWNQKKTQWGNKIGEIDNIVAYSNLGDANILNKSKDEYLYQNQTNKNLFVEKIYIGQKYQCVHYARNFWIQYFDSYFGSVNTADQIFYLEYGYDIMKNKSYPLQKFSNGKTDIPKFGDLLIWEKNKETYPNGHVAVVLNIEINSLYPHILIAEQNYDQIWDAKHFSRALKVKLSKNEEVRVESIRQIFPGMEDYKCKEKLNVAEGEILGWVRLKIQ